MGTSQGRGHWQRVLLVGELAFVVTLLVATGVFVVSFVNVLRADLDFARGNLVRVSVSRSFSATAAADRGSATETFGREVLECRVVRSVGLTGPEEAVRPEMYLPIQQDDTGRQSTSGDVIVRLSDETTGAVAALQEAVRPFAMRTRPQQVRGVEQRFRDLTATRRFSAGLMTAFGLLALVMAAAGAYGLTSFLVAQQSRALGLRVALGATRGRIFRGVVKDAVLPARRASRVDPLVTLRSEVTGATRPSTGV